MNVAKSLELPQILAVFTEEITRRSGQVLDTVLSVTHLQSRSVLPHFAEARPDDRLQAGVALQASRSDVYVYPYLRRLVCRNGAIRVQAAQRGRFERIDWLPQAQALAFIRDAVVACCAEDAFTDAMLGVREAADARARDHDEMMRLVAQLARRVARREFVEILNRFRQGGDWTRYGLANAITAFARDTRDHRRRWDLEEFGGAVLAGDIGGPPDRNLAAARMTSRAEAAVEL